MSSAERAWSRLQRAEVAMRRIRQLIIAIASLGLLSACSVGMAMSGSRNPDLGAIKVGASRGEVELQLGSPIRSASLDNGARSDRLRLRDRQ